MNDVNTGYAVERGREPLRTLGQRKRMLFLDVSPFHIGTENGHDDVREVLRQRRGFNGPSTFRVSRPRSIGNERGPTSPPFERPLARPSFRQAHAVHGNAIILQTHEKDISNDSASHASRH